ncbi:MAG TPA: DUF4342 domain-containing protein [Gemmatimonadales bacterium]|nr:DUF4342 domain-containing protein [Gemmatimonadales bacterium]
MNDRTLTVRTASGRPLLTVGIGQGAALGAAAVMLAPRFTAVVALAGLLRGVHLTIDQAIPLVRDKAA